MKDGGPAFPEFIPAFPEPPQGNFPGGKGMALRDYFAAAAMQGLIASNDEGVGDRIEELPGYAYAIADAMLSEREKT